MGLFSFGGSRSRSRGSSRGQSTSSSSGESSSRSGSLGGSVSGGFSRSGGRSGSVGTSRQSVAFEDVFARLFGGAEGAAGNLDSSILTDAANQLFAGGTGFLESLGGDTGTAFLESRLAGQGEILDEQIGLLQEDVGRLFNEELLPGIESEAVAGGTLGGGRQGVAQGAAIREAASAFTRGASQLRSDDLKMRDAAAGTLAANNIASAQTGIAGLPQLLALAQAEMMGDMEPMRALAGILGPMQILTQGDSSSFGEQFATAEDFARAFSESFGRSDSSQRSQSQATSSSQQSSSSGSFSLGFG